MVSVLKGDGDIRNCSCYVAMKLLVHAIKVVEWMVTVNEAQFGFMPERGTNDVFILRQLQEEYHAKGKKLHMCLVDQEKAFDRVPREGF